MLESIWIVGSSPVNQFQNYQNLKPIIFYFITIFLFLFYCAHSVEIHMEAGIINYYYLNLFQRIKYLQRDCFNDKLQSIALILIPKNESSYTHTLNCAPQLLKIFSLWCQKDGHWAIRTFGVIQQPED